MGVLFEYDFPEILVAEDVLPYVQNDKEFVVIETPNHIIIDYVLASNTTFPAVEDSDPDEARIASIRRECRGIAFDAHTRHIVSRPFQKFFNVGEREFTLPNALPSMKTCRVHRKLDGSMIRPLWIGKTLRLATRKGITDVAMDAEACLVSMPFAQRTNYERFMSYCHTTGFTPIFEYVAPDNRIVIYYPQPQLVLTAVRNMYSGKYVPLDHLTGSAHFGPDGIVRADRLGDAEGDTLDTLMNEVRHDVQNEGVVVSFPLGGIVKIKSDWYCNLHRAKSALSRRHDLFGAVWRGSIDDLKPLMPSDMLAQLDEFGDAVTEHYDRAYTRLNQAYRKVIAEGMTRKYFALTSDLPQVYKHLVFRLMDGHGDVRYVLDDFIDRNLTSAKTFEKVMDLLDMNDDNLWPEL